MGIVQRWLLVGKIAKHVVTIMHAHIINTLHKCDMLHNSGNQQQFFYNDILYANK